jgi:hypothetical protein
MMGGDVTVASEPGEGSVFTVRLHGYALTKFRKPFQPKPVTDLV